MRHFLFVVIHKLRLEILFIAFSKDGYLHKSGWLKSYFKRKPVDLMNRPIPWFSYGIIDFLNERLTKELTVFEYGSGGSTNWLAERVKKVYSVESDKKWYELVKPKLSGNVNYYFEPIANIPYAKAAFLPLGKGFINYHSKINEIDVLFDVIIVDGVDRNNCIQSALSKLSHNGIIIVDNCEYKDELNEGIELLYKSKFKKLAFSGLSPSVTYETVTAIFYKPQNCLDI